MSNKDFIQGSLDKNPTGSKSSERWDQKLGSMMGSGQSQGQTQNISQGLDLGDQFETDLYGFQRVVLETEKGVIGTGNVGAEIAEGLNKERLFGQSNISK